jgi:hypothetical protein
MKIVIASNADFWNGNSHQALLPLLFGDGIVVQYHCVHGALSFVQF